MNRVSASALLLAVSSFTTAASAQVVSPTSEPARSDGTFTAAPVNSAPPPASQPVAPVTTTTQTTNPGYSANQNNELLARNARGELIALDDRAGFGSKRQWAFSSDAALSFTRTTFSGDSRAVTTVTLAPAADYFVIENLSVGGVVGVTYTKSGDSSSTRFMLGPRVGYNFEISRLLSVWPKIGFSYAYTNVDQKVAANTPGLSTTIGTDANSVALNLFVPVMIHPAPHFFAGLGPFVDTDLSGDTRATSWGLKLTLGGWVNPKNR